LVVSTVDDPRKAFHLGANDYIVKPASRESLLDSLRRLTSASQPSQVLIIDDDEKDRYLLKHKLRGTGLRIVEATNGVDGIAKAVAHTPTLIFLDLTMPGMDGFEVLHALKDDPRTQSIAVVIHTSVKLSDDRREQLLRDAAAIVSKEELGQD